MHIGPPRPVHQKWQRTGQRIDHPGREHHQATLLAFAAEIYSTDMADDREPQPTVEDSVDSESALSDLGEAYARLMGLESASAPDVENKTHEDPPESSEFILNEADEEDGHISPESILEAALFVGHPQNEPLSSRQLAGLMRGVDASEVEDLVAELRAKYEARGCPYAIVSQDDGYSMTLRSEHNWLRQKFYGKVREARLSQNAIDVLAIVASHQPIDRKQVDQLRGKSMGAVLNQLVRRQLLHVQRNAEKPRTAVYSTTQRFLDLFGLESVAELPNSEEI